MTEFTFVYSECQRQGEEDGYHPPSYDDKGDMMVSLHRISDDPLEFEIEVIDYDGESSIMWLQEGIGIGYWINSSSIAEFESVEDGVFVIEGVHGEYIRGDGWMTDDDEDWYFDCVRPATEEEIATKCIGRQEKAA